MKMKVLEAMAYGVPVVSNRDGLGARVRVEAGGRTQLFEVRGNGSYLSHNDTRVHAGLGAATRARVEIRWPSGRVDTAANVAGSFGVT